jgi:hypothetical protein
MHIQTLLSTLFPSRGLQFRSRHLPTGNRAESNHTIHTINSASSAAIRLRQRRTSRRQEKAQRPHLTQHSQKSTTSTQTNQPPRCATKFENDRTCLPPCRGDTVPSCGPILSAPTSSSTNSSALTSGSPLKTTAGAGTSYLQDKYKWTELTRKFIAWW